MTEQTPDPVRETLDELADEAVRARTASTLPDSGHRVEYGRGARRESAPGKGRFDLISPIAMTKLAKLLEQGAPELLGLQKPDRDQRYRTKIHH